MNYGLNNGNIGNLPAEQVALKQEALQRIVNVVLKSMQESCIVVAGELGLVNRIDVLHVDGRLCLKPFRMDDNKLAANVAKKADKIIDDYKVEMVSRQRVDALMAQKSGDCKKTGCGCSTPKASKPSSSPAPQSNPSPSQPTVIPVAVPVPVPVIIPRGNVGNCVPQSQPNVPGKVPSGAKGDNPGSVITSR